MELTSHRVADEREAHARATLAGYLTAHGVSATLADGPVGDRFLERAGGAGAPSAVFAEWFGEMLDLPAHEAEDAGWIAFLAASPAPAEQLLASFVSGRVVDAMRAASPLPIREAHLNMPAHDLAPPSLREALRELMRSVAVWLGIAAAPRAGGAR